MPSTTLNKPVSAKRSGYLPSLDGWRAIAILGVILVHDFPNAGFASWGSFGVPLFFAISGILISHRILEEETLTGAFHLGSFYIRRLFRIQPAALAYLAVIALLMLAGIVHEHWHFWLGALFLYENFLFHKTDYVSTYSFFSGHFWTLAVEEHFYLLISLLLFFVRRLRLTIFLTLFIVIKIAQVVAMHYTADPQLRRTYWQIQVLLFASVIATALARPAVRAAALRWLQPVPVLLLSALAFGLCSGLILPSLIHGRLQGLTGQILTYGFPFWVAATMLHPGSLVTRILELPPFRFVGRLSYSIYLWHILFFFRSDPFTGITFAPLAALGVRPWKYIATLLFAMASYYWVEKPLIRLGHRLAPSATAGRLDIAETPSATA